MIATLTRTERLESATRGLLTVGDLVLHTLELPWRDNARNVSCIPSGTYRMDFLPRSASGKYRNVYSVSGVDGRSGILVHNGNIPAHTHGCILVGKARGILAGNPAVLSSRIAMAELVEAVGERSINLVVIGGDHA